MKKYTNKTFTPRIHTVHARVLRGTIDTVRVLCVVTSRALSSTAAQASKKTRCLLLVFLATEGSAKEKNEMVQDSTVVQLGPLM